jgi:hypothetical protein
VALVPTFDPNDPSSPNRPATYGETNRDILRVLLKPSPMWVVAVLAAAAAMLWGGWCWFQQIFWGMGVSGYNPPVQWGVYIVTFVFWVGIGHAGTLISAILFLVRSRWRTGVYRASEAMTVFAVMTALLFPVLHLGRCWQVYWFFPYPNQRYLWMNFKSPLMWDVFAISTYFTVSAVFFYVGLIPDIAAVRDHSKGFVRKVYGVLAVGWRGTHQPVARFMGAYGFFAALAAPLVLSVHSVVSWDFAMAPTPGLALHHLPAVLRGRRHLLRLRHGHQPADADDLPVRLAQVRQHLALREPGQDVPAHERHPDLRVLDGVLRRLVLAEPVRVGHLRVARRSVRRLRLGVLT